MILHITSETAAARYIERAKDWAFTTRGLFNNQSSYAIAEFLANQDGLTIYISREGVEYNPA